MNIGVGAGAAVTGAADARNPWQAVVHAVRTVTVRAKISGGCRAVGRIVVTGGAVGQDLGRAGRMTIITGWSDTALSGSQQIGAVAQGAGDIKAAGSFVAVRGRAAPGGVRVGGIYRVAVFTAVDQISHSNIKARVAAGAAGGGCGMAFLAVFQIGLGIRPVKRLVRKRKRMRSGIARPTCMTSGRNAVAVGIICRKTAWCVRKRADTAPAGLVTQDAAGIDCFQGNRSMGGVIGWIAIVIGTLPVGRMSSGSWMTGRGRTGTLRIVEKIRIRDNAAVKIFFGFTVTAPA